MAKKRKLLGEEGKPSRRQLYDEFQKPEFQALREKPIHTVTRADCVEAAGRLLASFGYSPEDADYISDKEGEYWYHPLSHPYHDPYGPGVKVKETLANLVAWWLGDCVLWGAPLTVEDEGIYIEWLW